MASLSIIVTAKTTLKWICIRGNEGDTRVAATLIRNVYNALPCNIPRNLGRLVISKTRYALSDATTLERGTLGAFPFRRFPSFSFFFYFFPFPRTDESIPRCAARNSHGISLAINYCPRTSVCRPQRMERVSQSSHSFVFARWRIIESFAISIHSCGYPNFANCSRLSVFFAHPMLDIVLNEYFD